MIAALLWASAPVLACLPNGAMTAEEMACCQKMAGNCDMGGGSHKCCDTSVNRATASPALAPSSVAHDSSPQVLSSFLAVEELALQPADPPFVLLVPLAASPPGALFILKN
jgi:hypothetical protein